jgi:hypothetical protein
MPTRRKSSKPWNLQMVVNLGNYDTVGNALVKYVAKRVVPYPSRFAVMANIDLSMVNDPEFGPKRSPV